MALRLTKLEAAARLKVSSSTIDRMIQRGDLQTERELHGSRHRVWVLMADEAPDASQDAADAVSDSSSVEPYDLSGSLSNDVRDASSATELAVLKERVKGLEELADYHRQLLKDSEWRYQQVSHQLSASQSAMETLTKALPAADAITQRTTRRRWWPFSTGHR